MSDEIGSMPLSRWNESVFRYFFCQRLAASHPDVTQFVECDHVDLVLHGLTEKAFIEFKFYLRQQKFDPYSGSAVGFKGGPGSQNLGEFRKCVSQLHGRTSVSGLSKYVALVYADREGTAREKLYSAHYDDYRHTDESITLELLESKPIRFGGEQIGAKLFTVR